MTANSAMKRVLALVLALAMVLSCGVLTASAEVSTSATVINIPLKITASNLEYPTTITVGNASRVAGVLTASYGTITNVKAIISKGTKTYQSTSWRPNTKSVNLASTVNTKLKFGKLSTGTYTLKIVATASYKGLKSVTKTVLTTRVKVVAKTPSITVTGADYPTGTLYEGEIFNVSGTVKTSCGKLTYVRCLVMDEDGKIILSTDATPNKTSYAIRYTLSPKLPISLLPAGNYTYKLTAKALYNGKTYSSVLVESQFTVKAD